MKILDTKAYLSSLKELVETGEEVAVPVSGSSMTPFLGDSRDWILMKKPERQFRVGDMVFYQRNSGQFVMHRIYKVKPEGCYMIGDSQWQQEGPIAKEQIFAYIIKVKRKEKWIGPGNLCWEFFEHIWIRLVPLRKSLTKIYLVLKGKSNL